MLSNHVHTLKICLFFVCLSVCVVTRCQKVLTHIRSVKKIVKNLNYIGMRKLGWEGMGRGSIQSALPPASPVTLTKSWIKDPVPQYQHSIKETINSLRIK